MPAAFWGTLSALAWGSADFLARFTGSRLGLLAALFGMMASSALLLLIYALATGLPWMAPGSDLWRPPAAGLVLAIGTFLLYAGLVRGPVSVVAPLVSSYPLFSLAIALIEGLRPDPLQWLAVAGVMLGVVAVARFGREADSRAAAQKGGLPATLAMALGSAVTLALGIWFLQGSQPIYGELQSLIVVRALGAVATLPFLLLLPRQRRAASWRWWPVVLLQGLLDAGAYVTLQIGLRGPDAAIAVVVSSAFCVVPVLLARFILRERVSAPQWAGIALVVASVAILSA
jgi:drug/metabolite transporter (DMT)-like permease